MLIISTSEVSSRCHQAWGLLPEHLQYTSSCWESDLPIGVKLISIISYIAYLYNEFSIQSLLYQDSKRTDSALLDVSSEILSTILTLGRQWERSVDIKGDFTWIVSRFWLPNGSQLIFFFRLLFMGFHAPGF
jgi:hypothetical protein